MTPFEAYRAFVALKRHFAPGSTYDFHKYNGKTNATQKSYEARNDRYFYEKLARRYDPQGYMVANFIENPKLWIGDLFGNDQCEERYERHIRIKEGLSYNVFQELSGRRFVETFCIQDGQHPPALELSPEVLSAMDIVTGFTKHWEAYSWDPSIKGCIHLTRKLRGFLEFDRQAMRDNVAKIFVHEAA